MAAALLLAGCTHAAAPPPVLSEWRQAALPASAEIDDLAVCGGHWYAVGALATGGSAETGPDAARRPAAWSSYDGRRWSALPTVARSVYGRVSRLYAVACRPQTSASAPTSAGAPTSTGAPTSGAQPELAALGAAIGGVHGNPRTAAWTLTGGTLRELPAAFELFGGPSALSVGRLAGGEAGWLITGGWVTAGRGGAAAWQATSTNFAQVTTPGSLASAPGEQTVATDATPLAGGWLVGGSTTVLSGDRAGQRQPLAWRSTPAGWVRERLPIGSDAAVDAGLDQIVTSSAGLVYAAGSVLSGRSPTGHFALWRRLNGRWTSPVTIGPVHPTGSVVPAIRGLAVSGRTVVVAAGDGARLRLWLSIDAGRGWRELTLPPGVAARDDGAARLTVAVSDRDLVVSLGSDRRSGLWSASLLD